MTSHWGFKTGCGGNISHKNQPTLQIQNQFQSIYQLIMAHLPAVLSEFHEARTKCSACCRMPDKHWELVSSLECSLYPHCFSLISLLLSPLRSYAFLQKSLRVESHQLKLLVLSLSRYTLNTYSGWSGIRQLRLQSWLSKMWPRILETSWPSGGQDTTESAKVTLTTTRKSQGGKATPSIANLPAIQDPKVFETTLLQSKFSSKMQSPIPRWYNC